LSLPDHDMSVQDINDTPLQINMSVKPANPESRRCVLVAFTCLHFYTLMSVNKFEDTKGPKEKLRCGFNKTLSIKNQTLTLLG
jgi:hypothetical protein